MIKDSETRREFGTGAVRDIQEGKGRCDLIPLGAVGVHINAPALTYIAHFRKTVCHIRVTNVVTML